MSRRRVERGETYPMYHSVHGFELCRVEHVSRRHTGTAECVTICVMDEDGNRFVSETILEEFFHERVANAERMTADDRA